VVQDLVDDLVEVQHGLGVFAVMLRCIRTLMIPSRLPARSMFVEYL
jgi:hypothetical protein